MRTRRKGHASAARRNGTCGGQSADLLLIENWMYMAVVTCRRGGTTRVRYFVPLLGETDRAPSLNLSACHGCSLVSEPSCETANRLLDRQLVLGGSQVPDLLGGVLEEVRSLARSTKVGLAAAGTATTGDAKAALELFQGGFCCGSTSTRLWQALAGPRAQRGDDGQLPGPVLLAQRCRFVGLSQS